MEQLPDKTRILEWIKENPSLAAKRDIAKAFGIKSGAGKVELKRILHEMQDDGSLAKKRRTFREAATLPPVSILMITGPDNQGDLFAKPLEWDGTGAEPRILVVTRTGDPAMGAGDRILARLTEVTDPSHSHEARLIRKIGSNPIRMLGIFREASDGGRIVPVDKGNDKEWRVARDATLGAKDGELVEVEQAGPKRLGLPAARVVERLGDPMGSRAVSMIAIHQHGIPDHFPDAAIAEAEAAGPAPLDTRVDMRDLPLVTIDPVDARDRDDAVLAQVDTDPKNPGGFIIWVAIADVAHYVRAGGALDREARKRGNSSYFPDRVVPMLPDVLSGDLCSLHEHVDRACLAVRMVVGAGGQKVSHRFVRGLMRSQGSLNYEQVQRAIDGSPDPVTAVLLEPVLRPLYAVYQAIKGARAAREPLDLDLPERKIVLDDAGKVTSVAYRDRLDAHRLIEEFMIMANVAAAEELIGLKTPLLFRVHEEPSPEKLDALRDVAEASGFVLAKGQVLKTAHLNRLLAQARGTDFAELMNITTLRSMTQAYYHPENFGHFGLALRSYAHFTSPIRRYSDLIVHRALITAHRWGKDGLSPQDIEDLPETAKQISDTERRSMIAERDTNDRYLAAFLADRVGAEFTGRIAGVQRFGLFVKLDETGADGLVPIRSVGNEFFHFDADAQTLMGADSGVVLGMGQRVTVRLAEADPLTGGLMLEIVELENRAMPAGALAKRGRFVPRKPGAAAARDAKRKVIRRRK